MTFQACTVAANGRHYPYYRWIQGNICTSRLISLHGTTKRMAMYLALAEVQRLKTIQIVAASEGIETSGSVVAPNR